MGRKIGVLRVLSGLGDFLCLVPALRALRHGEPDADIRLIGPPPLRPLVERFPEYLDGILELPHFPGLTPDPGDPREVAARIGEIQAESFDLMLQQHGSGIVSNPLALLLGARKTAGFYLPGQFLPDPNAFIPWPADQPEIHRHLSLLEHLGYERQGDHLEFPQTDEDRARAEELLRLHDVGDAGYVVLHPGASEPEKRWPAENFAAVGNLLAAAGHRVVITGDAGEREVAAEVAESMSQGAVDLAGETNLGSLASILCAARLLVTNDTGVSHLASGCVTPSIVIFTGPSALGGTPHRWAPLNRQRHISLEARPNRQSAVAGDEEAPHCPVDVMERCLRDGCTLPEREERKPAGRVTVSDVQGAVERLLGRRP